MLTHSGLLLEHFARLATNVAGTSSATIGVLGRRNELEVTRAGYGLTREQLNAVQDIEPTLASGPDLTVVTDLAKDDRFGRKAALFDAARPALSGLYEIDLAGWGARRLHLFS